MTQANLRLKQRDLMAVSYPKSKQFAPTTRAAGGQSKADPHFPAGGKNFWVLHVL
ncbi:hypothetical protein SLEP1_g55402 [Rubroshorea leprosula]|uniref:Uncharacterized protein n=1 Tax=Rubroshorea leprosula TaxID=152421 RepID=A0AAV5MFN1_9ROSI|nr:hypothetical protein SLEP1_g55402 [Rubroshorea leprosula]